MRSIPPAEAATCHAEPVRKLLVLLAVVWMVANVAGAWISVTRKLPYDLSFLDQPGRVGNVGNDWLYGWGTGLAMPLATVAGMAVLTIIATFPGAPGRVGAFVIALLGGVSVAFTLANQLTHDRLSSAAGDRVETALIIATLVSGGLLVLVGFLTWLTDSRD